MKAVFPLAERLSKMVYRSSITGQEFQCIDYTFMDWSLHCHLQITFKLCRDYVDDWALISEEEIEKAVYFMLEKHHKVGHFIHVSKDILMLKFKIFTCKSRNISPFLGGFQSACHICTTIWFGVLATQQYGIDVFLLNESSTRRLNFLSSRLSMCTQVPFCAHVITLLHAINTHILIFSKQLEMIC